MKSEIKCAYRVNRFQTQWIVNTYWIVVRFSSNRVLQQWHESNVSINIIRIECNVTGAHTAMISPCIRYMNFRRACHQDIRYRKDRQIIYLPIIVRSVTDLMICVVDQDGRFLNFFGEITIILYIRKGQR